MTLLTDFAELKLIRSQLPGLLLLASQRVAMLPSFAAAAVRLLPDWPDAVAVPVRAKLLPLATEEELLDEGVEDELLELLDELLGAVLDEELLGAVLDEELLAGGALLVEPPQVPATAAASFKPLPAPAEASAMHLAFTPGYAV